MPTSSRTAHALRCLAAAGAIRLFVACTPTPPDRRVSAHGNIYWGPKYAQCAGALLRGFAEQLKPRDPELRTEYVVFTEAVSQKPKKSILSCPEYDCDNVAKAPLDAITKTQRIWVDDKQVGFLLSCKRWAAPGEEAGVHVVVNILHPEG